MERALVRLPARRLAHLALALGLAAAPLACGGDDDDDGGTGPTTQPPLQVTVNMADFTFSPTVVTVRAGGTVTWTNTGNAPHTSTSSTGLWDSGQVPAGQSFPRQFPDAGTFPYVCSLHAGMTGTVVAR